MDRKQVIIFGIEVTLLSVMFLIWWFFLGIWNTPTQEVTQDHDTQKIYKTISLGPDSNTVSQEYAQADEFLVELSNGLLNTPWIQTAHNSAQWVDIEKICGLFSSICNKTTWDGTYTADERLNYQWLLIHLIKQLDRRLVTDQSLESVLSGIKLSAYQPDRRGSAWHTHVRFNTSKIDSWNEFFQVSVHEMIHIIDLWVVQWRSVFRNSDFTEFGKTIRASNDPSIDFYQISRLNENTKKQTQWPEHFVSGYALKNIYEDKAETATFFLLYHDLFVEKAKTNPILKQKYNYINTLFGGSYLQSWQEYSTAYDTRKNYWDVTRLFEDLR